MKLFAFALLMAATVALIEGDSLPTPPSLPEVYDLKCPPKSVLTGFHMANDGDKFFDGDVIAECTETEFETCDQQSVVRLYVDETETPTGGKPIKGTLYCGEHRYLKRAKITIVRDKNVIGGFIGSCCTVKNPAMTLTYDKPSRRDFSRQSVSCPPGYAMQTLTAFNNVPGYYRMAAGCTALVKTVETPNVTSN